MADRAPNDVLRQRYLEMNFDAIRKLRKEAKLFASIHWSLTDNFEWAFGRGPRFGMVDIDYEHKLTRKPRPSLVKYRDLIRKFLRESPAPAGL